MKNDGKVTETFGSNPPILDKYFGVSGLISQKIENFEYRAEQVQMAQHVWQSLLDSQNLIIEAGTGVGKSLAYLIPLCVWALENKKRVAISTETKALQEQIIQKEIPFIRELGIHIQHEVAFGTANYLCLRKLFNLIARGSFQPSEREHIRKIQSWIREEGAGGLRQNIPFAIPGKLWEEICREGDNSLNRNCPHFQECFYQRAKRSWQKASLIVLNHSLYFASLAAGANHLPSFDIVIFDEAHNLEKIISEQFSFKLSLKNFDKIFSRIREGRRFTLFELLSGKESIKEFKEDFSLIKNLAREFFTSIPNPVNGSHLRLRERLGIDSNFFPVLQDFFSRLKDAYEKRSGERSDAVGSLTDEEVLFIDSILGRLGKWLGALTEVMEFNREDMVYWISRDKEEGVLIEESASLHGAPVNIRHTMRTVLEDGKDVIMLVSATLSLNGNFRFIRERLGLDENFSEVILASPFDYKKQVLLYSSPSLGDPKYNFQAYSANVINISEKLIRITNGHAFVLCTSYRMMEEIYLGLEHLQAEGFNLVFQESGFTSLALKEYLSLEKPVLIGTSSFWQGIDIPGDDLKLVVLTRIPFSVPDDPLVEAKLQELEKAGINSFMHYSVPLAAMKLKQGFGRLIRSSRDRGIIAILDSRICNKSYGQILWKALPAANAFQSLEDIEKNYLNLIRQ